MVQTQAKVAAVMLGCYKELSYSKYLLGRFYR